MVYNWNKMVTITVPVGLNGWQTRGRVIINGRECTFPVGVETQVPEPVAAHIQRLIAKEEEESKPPETTGGCVDEVARQQISVLSEELKGNGPHQMLVTGADGSTKWEDRTHWAEDNSKIYNEFSVANGTYDDADGAFVFSVDNIPFSVDEELANAFFEGTGGVFIDGVAYKAYPVIGSSNHMHITSMEGKITEETPFKITVYKDNIETFSTTLAGETQVQ